MTLDEFKNDYDWRTIFMEGDYKESNMMGGVDSASNPTTREVRSFTMSDIVEVVAADNGERDAVSWVGVFKTADGAYLYVSAGCDYTGWDCQASSSAEWHTDLEQCKAMIHENERLRLFPEGQ